MELNSREIMEILPHRYPFLLVDKITELEAGVKAVGIKMSQLMKCTFWDISRAILSCLEY